ncbi:dbp10 [Ecytonucleospora hepatopenaei]|uniref:RNA helicase n=1 Tax=Ecytonucleospora hepatopenaei TaxID=646526 RepID=A0A1W0E4Z3_9MICR|nr:dbp10 [Ecytonucleospora hepatopenaei]
MINELSNINNNNSNNLNNNSNKLHGGSFNTLNLHPLLYSAITAKYNTPTPIQRKTIPKLMLGGSLMAIARTGSGKTLCYLIPAIQHALNNKNTLILCPTKELAKQIQKVLEEIKGKIKINGRIKITTLNSNLDLKQVYCNSNKVNNDMINIINNLNNGISHNDSNNGISQNDSNNDILQNDNFIHNERNTFNQLVNDLNSKYNLSDINTFVDFLVVDEFDRIMEEPSLKNHFDKLTANYSKQRAYFSATLPVDPVKEISSIVKIESKIPESISHYFYYVATESKEGALLSIISDINKNSINTYNNNNFSDKLNNNNSFSDKLNNNNNFSDKLNNNNNFSDKLNNNNIGDKLNNNNNFSDKLNNNNDNIIIFTATKYAVDLLCEILNHYGFKTMGIYSGMDDEARQSALDAFVKGKIRYLVVTDVAARGLDIPRVTTAISYDMCDEKTYVHRAGRVRGIGDSISLVTYSDIFQYYNIRETHFKINPYETSKTAYSSIINDNNNLNDNDNSIGNNYSKHGEIGMLPQNMLDRFDLKKFTYARQKAMRGYQKCLQFRGKVSVPSEYKSLVNSIGIHSKYRQKETLADQIKKIRNGNNKNGISKNKYKNIFKDNKNTSNIFKDKFYIPYNKHNTLIHSSAFGINKDDYIAERKTKQRIYFKKRDKLKNNKQ